MGTRIHLRIRGKVQGVGFRWFVREQARRCGLAGWVRNNLDGSVELEVGGEEECLARFRAAVEVGPPNSRVEHIEEPSGELEQGPVADLPYPFLMAR